MSDSIFKKMGSTIAANLDALKAELQAEIANIQSYIVTMNMSGTYDNTTGTTRKHFLSAATFTKIRVTTGTTTSATQVQLKKNGTVVATISLSNGVVDSGIQTISLSVTTTDYLTADVTGTGTDLTVMIA